MYVFMYLFIYLSLFCFKPNSIFKLISQDKLLIFLTNRRYRYVATMAPILVVEPLSPMNL